MPEVALEQVTGPPSATQKERPWLFSLLIAPNAVLANGIISGVLSYLLRQQGVGIGRSSQIISLLILPQTIYCLWTPITDFWIRRRSWLIVGAVSSAAAMFAAFHTQRLDKTSAVILMFLSACLGQLVVSSCGGIMGSLRSEVSRRRASSFYQGGSLGFGALGIFVLASCAERFSVVTLGWIAAALIAVPSLAAFAAPDRATNIEPGRTLQQTFSCIWQEVKATFFRWRAIPYTLIMIFPMASGSAIGLFPGIAQDYHVSGQQMAWINGIGGALLTASGALSATLIPARIRASVAYLSVALISEVTIAILWLGPLSPFTYYIGVTLYLFTIGACYALFTAVVLEFLGSSGKSGSGRYSVINGLGNVPVLYMTTVDGAGGKLWGARGLAGTDAVVGGIGAVILLTYFLIHKSSNSQVATVANCD